MADRDETSLAQQSIEAYIRYRNVFGIKNESDDGPWVLTHLMNMLGFWDKAETDEARTRRNVAVEILEILGIGRISDRFGLITELVRYPVTPPDGTE